MEVILFNMVTLFRYEFGEFPELISFWEKLWNILLLRVQSRLVNEIGVLTKSLTCYLLVQFFGCTR